MGLEQGSLKRNIYLPIGHWIDGNHGSTYDGPIWIEDYSADLYTLPYFLAA